MDWWRNQIAYFLWSDSSCCVTTTTTPITFPSNTYIYLKVYKQATCKRFGLWSRVQEAVCRNQKVELYNSNYWIFRLRSPSRYTKYFLFPWHKSSSWARSSSLSKPNDHRHTIVGRIPLDKWSARRRDLYLTTNNTHNRQTTMPPGGIRTHNPRK